MNELAVRVIAIAAGGAIGAVARYGVGAGCVALWGPRFGYGTLLVNVVGCFLLGLLMHEGLVAAERDAPAWHVGLTVGLLGGLTTFSTFGYQTVRHVADGEALLALANVGLNVVVGLVAAAGGVWLAQALWPASAA